jgi:hypothetical protein
VIGSIGTGATAVVQTKLLIDLFHTAAGAVKKDANFECRVNSNGNLHLLNQCKPSFIDPFVSQLALS